MRLAVHRYVRLFLLIGGCFGPSQGILNGSSSIYWKYRLCFHGPRNRFFPGLQHRFHIGSCTSIHSCVGVDECTVEALAKEKGVRSPNILHNRIKNVKCWQFAGCRNLRRILAYGTYNLRRLRSDFNNK